MNKEHAKRILPIIQAFANGADVAHNGSVRANLTFEDYPTSYSIIEPWTLGRKIPGFRTLQEGEEWHRSDWTQEMLEGGWRPFIVGESGSCQIASLPQLNWEDWHLTHPCGGEALAFLRTRSPLPPVTFDQDGQTWFHHTPGDEMPVDGETTIKVMFRDREVDSRGARAAKAWRWNFLNNDGDIIAYRLAEKRKVSLGPEDVPPGSVIRGAGEIDTAGWCLITSCSEAGIRIWRHCGEQHGREITWQELQESGSQILRPGSTWQPCEKEVES